MYMKVPCQRSHALHIISQSIRLSLQVPSLLPAAASLGIQYGRVPLSPIMEVTRLGISGGCPSMEELLFWPLSGGREGGKAQK